MHEGGPLAGWALGCRPFGDEAIDGDAPGIASPSHHEWTSQGTARFCRHHCAYPHRLRGQPLSPPLLDLLGSPERLRRLLERKVVATVGTRGATGYGKTVAHSLARELAASGVTVAAVDREPIGSAALEGARAAASASDLRAPGRGAALVISSTGKQVPGRGSRANLDLMLASGGCALSEPSPGEAAPSWSRLAALRTLVLLSDVLVVVEAPERSMALACARLASECDVTVAAVPGPIDSPNSYGCNALIATGASLVIDAGAVLDLLHGAGGPTSGVPRRARGGARRVAAPRRSPKAEPAPEPRPRFARQAPVDPASSAPQQPASTLDPSLALDQALALDPAVALDPALAGVLERVQRGASTMAELCLGGSDCSGVALALTELELLGLLHRGEDGRYTGGDTSWVR